MNTKLPISGQKSALELEQELYDRADKNSPSLAHGNTPDIQADYHFQQQTDIQRKDQKPHTAPSPSTPDKDISGNQSVPDKDRGRSEKDIGKGTLTKDAVLDQDILTPDDPTYPDRYVSNTPYHR